MNKSYLKKLNDNIPDLLKLLGKNFIRNRLIKNKIFISTYNKIEKFRKLDGDEQKSIQFHKLKEKLIYAYENVEYYRKNFDKVKFNPYEFKNFEQIKILPTISKNDILDNFHLLCSKENIDFYEGYTGGSSGKPLKILLDKDSIYKERAFVYNFWNQFGYDYQKSKMVTFRGVECGKKMYKYNPLYNELLIPPFKLNHKNLEKYIEKINKFKPEFISGYPSAISTFSKLIKSKNIKMNLNIKAIFLISENITLDEKNIISEIFNCPITSFYGHSERAVFAELLNDSYIFNKLYGYAELIPLEDNKYRIVCTGFVNKKMPLIRYITDDIVELKDLKLNIIGHWDKELLIGKNGEKISIASINFHSNEFNKINKYQFVQNEIGKISIYLQKDQQLLEDDLIQIKNVLNRKLKGILDYNLVIVDEIKLTNRGKLKKIIQNMK